MKTAVSADADGMLIPRQRRIRHFPSSVLHFPFPCPPLRVGHWSVRLACVRHAASVRPEPGSNSLLNRSLTAVAGRYSLLKERFRSFRLSDVGVFSCRLHVPVSSETRQIFGSPVLPYQYNINKIKQLRFRCSILKVRTLPPRSQPNGSSPGKTLLFQGRQIILPNLSPFVNPFFLHFSLLFLSFSALPDPLPHEHGF